MNPHEKYLATIASNAIMAKKNYYPTDYRQDEDEDQRSANAYPYQFVGVNEFVWTVRKAKLHYCRFFGRRPTTFLDVGCGVGATLLLAIREFSVAHGIECSQELINVFTWLKNEGINGSRFCNDPRYPEPDKKPELKVFHNYAESFNAYTDYDIIYHFNISKNKQIKYLIRQRMGRESLIVHLGGFSTGCFITKNNLYGFRRYKGS